MTKVYLVVNDDYDYFIYEIFSLKEKAKEYVNKHDDPNMKIETRMVK